MLVPSFKIALEFPPDFSETVAVKIAEQCQTVAEGHRYVGMREACQILNVTRSRLKTMCAHRLIAHYPGDKNSIEFRVSDLWNWKDQKRKEAA